MEALPSPAHDAGREPPEAPDALDSWLEARLGRALTVAILCRANHAPSRLTRLANALASHGAFRVGTEQLPVDATEEYAQASLRKVAALAPDTLLICDTLPDAERWQSAWCVQVLRLADDAGLAERTFLALIGTGVARASARRMGFEDGFDLGQDPAVIARAIAREAVAGEEIRRRGSSPPCYL